MLGIRKKPKKFLLRREWLTWEKILTIGPAREIAFLYNYMSRRKLKWYQLVATKYINSCGLNIN